MCSGFRDYKNYVKTKPEITFSGKKKFPIISLVRLVLLRQAVLPSGDIGTVR
jgi:hypothetical protein